MGRFILRRLGQGLLVVLIQALFYQPQAERIRIELVGLVEVVGVPGHVVYA